MPQFAWDSVLRTGCAAAYEALFRVVPDRPEHAGKNYRVNWVQHVPIDLSGQTARLEPCAAPQKRAVMGVGV